MAAKSSSAKPRKRSGSSSNGSAPKAKSRSTAKPSRSAKPGANRSRRSGGSRSAPKSRTEQAVGTAKQQAGQAADAAKHGADQAVGTAKTVAEKAKGPALAAGAAAAGIAGGVALASRGRGRRSLLSPRRKVLGIPIERKSSALKTAELLRDGAKQLHGMTGTVSRAADDAYAIREQLDKANRQSPLEVVLDGLTHRRGAHRRED